MSRLGHINVHTVEKPQHPFYHPICHFLLSRFKAPRTNHCSISTLHPTLSTGQVHNPNLQRKLVASELCKKRLENESSLSSKIIYCTDHQPLSQHNVYQFRPIDCLPMIVCFRSHESQPFYLRVTNSATTSASPCEKSCTPF